MSELVATRLCRRFGAHAALIDVSFELAAGQHVCVMGHSGSGKTTLLRAIAGLETLDAGELWLAGARIDGLPAERRPTRTVFQLPALFPHLCVLDNVTFVDRVGRHAEPAPLSATDLLARLGLPPERFAARRVEALSGGERQRVALARALYRPPPWLLLDEPLSALDRPLRAELRRALAGIRNDEGIGMLHVTHEAVDALALADRLLIISDARLIASGDPLELYRRPPDLVTARLLGELTRAPSGNGWLRPERLHVVAPEQGRVTARLLARRCAGAVWDHELAIDNLPTPLLATRQHPWEGPERCGLQWHDDDILDLS